MDQIKRKMRQLRAEADEAAEKCEALESEKKQLTVENEGVSDAFFCVKFFLLCYLSIVLEFFIKNKGQVQI